MISSALCYDCASFAFDIDSTSLADGVSYWLLMTSRPPVDSRTESAASSLVTNASQCRCSEEFH